MSRITSLKIRRELLIALFLVTVTACVYGQVIDFKFINYDDPEYVYDNPNIQSGLSTESIIWSFTTDHASNWHPITWVSHIIDVEIFGMNPGGHHFTNVIFHIVNSLLLFLVLKKATGGLWQSGFVAALFALHPLHVESVVWISERKDVLSTFFGLLTIWKYIAFVERPNTYRYVWVVVCFMLGLMAKPMLVTLPLVLLLFDYWPFNRCRGWKSRTLAPHTQYPLTYLIYEKSPLFLLSAASCIITFSVQKTGRAVVSLDILSLNTRIANALVSYVSYIAKMFWPFNLSVFYPYPKGFVIWQVAGTGLLLLAISFFSIRHARKRPYFFVGWFWYVLTLIPVIGLVQVGRQAMADRYTYIPLIGLFMVIAWEGSASLRKWCAKKWPGKNKQTAYGHIILSMISVSILIALSISTWFQIRYWSNSIKLYEHTLDVAGNSFIIHYNLGNIFLYQGQYGNAIDQYEKALMMDPNSKKVANNLGLALFRSNQVHSAGNYFFQALRLDPGFPEPHNHLGNICASQGNLDQAVEHYLEALRLDAKYADAFNNLGLAMIRQGKIIEAIAHFRKALKINPYDISVNRNLNRALSLKEKIDKAVDNMLQTLNSIAKDSYLNNKLDDLRMGKKELDAAIDYYQKALSAQPGYTKDALNINNYAKVHRVIKDYDKTLSMFMESKLKEGPAE